MPVFSFSNLAMTPQMLGKNVFNDYTVQKVYPGGVKSYIPKVLSPKVDFSSMPSFSAEVYDMP